MSWDRLQQGLVNRALAVLGVAVLAALLVLAGLAERGGRRPGDVVTAADDPAAVTPGAAAGRWITLVSGDRVLVSSQGGTADVLTVDPAPGRERMTFQTRRADGELYVVPGDAVPLLAEDRLDQRLFGVSGLLQHGYDDASRPDLPLIVTGTGSDAAVKAAIARVSESTTPLPSVDGVAVQQPKDTTADLWATLTATAAADAEAQAAGAQPKVWLDGPVTASLDESVPQVGAPDAWAAGHSGAGAVVAVLDTGIDETHADLTDAVLQAQDFSGSPRGTADFIGHGTHVASIVTGSGAASDGRFKGVAPDAQLLVGKVLDDTGSGYESWIIAGMEWAAAQGADVANLSLGTWLPGTGVEPMDLAVDQLSAETGTLFVVSAGNRGPTPEWITSPGSATAALTVGAVDDNDELAPFSSRGPRYRRPAVKPEITAPGVDIVAARAKPSHLGTPIDDAYTRLSGTSMAAPHVAGAAAILAAEHPDWGGEQLKAALVASADPNDGATVFEQGAGRLDVARADRQTVYPTTGTVDAGVVPWPHADDEPVATPVTFHNAGAAAVTLDLDVSMRDDQGDPAVPGMFTLDADELTVPAGGDATVTVTSDMGVDGPEGLYGGVLEATGGDGEGVTLRTPINITKELTTYEVTVEAFDTHGEPALDASVAFDGLDRPTWEHSWGTEPLRLPAGRYFMSVVLATDEHTTEVLFAEPVLVVDHDQTITLDARDAQPIGATIDRSDAEAGYEEAQITQRTAFGLAGAGGIGHAQHGTRLLAVPSATSGDDAAFTARVLLARYDGLAGFTDSPYLYHVQWTAVGGIPEQLTRHVSDRRLARVTSTHASASTVETTGTRDGMVTMTLPATLEERFSPGYSWPRILDTESSAGTTSNWALVKEYEAGRRYRERWNGAVLGPIDAVMPSLSIDPLYPYQLARWGNDLLVATTLFSDRPDHWSLASTESYTTTLTDDTGTSYDTFPAWGYEQFVGLPDDERTYRLEQHATRAASELSSRVDVAWTFRAAYEGVVTPMPLMSARFAPELDDHNRAPSGRRFSFPLHIGRQSLATYGTLTSVTVEASFDDGATWKWAQVRGRGDDRTVTVKHPARGGYVSLRVKAVDSAGNSIEQTTIRAYALKG